MPLYVPTVHVWPETVGYGATVSVRTMGSELMAFRFMGAVPGADDAWMIRLDPFFFPQYSEGVVVAKDGDVLPLGPIPAVDVQFVQITPTELVLKAVGIHTFQDQN